MKKTYRDSIFVNQRKIKSKHVKVGDYTYYSGYYHGGDFNDCVLYLDEIDDLIQETDELIIGKFCCIASGVKFIMGGNPAKFIKKRFSQEKIDELLKLKWWNWDLQKILENMNTLLASAE